MRIRNIRTFYALVTGLSFLATAGVAELGYDPMTHMLATPDPVEEVAEAPAADLDLEGLPEGPGAEDTYYQCVACHSTDIIKQQRLTDARWDYLWDWMIKDQGMAETDEETRELILSYLKQNFSSER